jgi:hypothetical protein
MIISVIDDKPFSCKIFFCGSSITGTVTFACDSLFDLWLNRGRRMPKELIDMKSLSRYVIILRLVVSVICPGIALGLIKNKQPPPSHVKQLF